MENNSPSTFSRAFKGIWIPKEIWLDRRLTYFEKCLLAEINSLDDPEKGCFASNKYFMDFFDELERTIQKGLAKLKNLGYITYEKFDGRIRVLRSNLFADKTFLDTPGVNKSSPHGCQIIHPSPIGESIDRDNKAYNKDIKKHPPNPPERGEARVACGAFVKLTKEEKEALERTYGVLRVQELIEEINDYLASTGKKPYKDYAAAVRQWARRRNYLPIKNPEPSQMPLEPVLKPRETISSDPKVQSDWEWLEKVRERSKGIRDGIRLSRIWFGEKYVEFFDLPEAKFFYGDNGFRASVESALRKLNIWAPHGL